jgi:hypothetical protein
MNNKKKLVFFQQRFFPAGTYNWTVPNGCESVDVFLVGGGGGGYDGSGGGGGPRSAGGDGTVLIRGYKY